MAPLLKFYKVHHLLFGFLLTVSWVGFVACGSDDTAAPGDDDDDTPTAAERTTDDISSTLTVTSNAINEALTNNNAAALVVEGTKNTAVDETVDCPTGGTAQATGTIDEPAVGDVDLDITLTACEAASGTLTGTLEIIGTYSGNNPYTVDVTASGTINGENCTITVTNLTINGTYNGSSTTGTMSGGATATCDGDTVSCTWNDVDFTNGDAIEAGCS